MLPSPLMCRIITGSAEVGSAASLTGLPVGPSSELVTRNVWPESDLKYTRIRKLANFFQNLVPCDGDELDLPDQSRPGSAVRGP
jgi:hypothetical protein